MKHDTGPHHPENARRLEVLHNQLISSGLEYISRYYDAPSATDSEICRVHSEKYLSEIKKATPASGYVSIDSDTVICPCSLEAARHAAGAGILGTTLLIEGKNNTVFCPVRPPGHHAERAGPAGFCIFNNVAIATAHALEHYSLERIAIIDFDAHHGNGIEDIFAGDERVLYCSSFQHPFYPHSGTPPSSDNILPIPLPAGTKGYAFREAVRNTWLDGLRNFAPQIVIFAAGFDGHALDEMSDLQLTESDFAWVTTEVRKSTFSSTADRYLSILEGGYQPEATARSVIAHLKAFFD